VRHCERERVTDLRTAYFLGASAKFPNVYVGTDGSPAWLLACAAMAARTRSSRSLTFDDSAAETAVGIAVASRISGVAKVINLELAELSRLSFVTIDSSWK
jgi:hypothetical protein